jgi:AraC family ethanolamine operon transcriptional activator
MLAGALHSRPSAPRQRIGRYDTALAACRIIHADTDQRLGVRDVASQLGIGARALQYAFRNVLGLSPAQYMLAARLNQARHQLRRALVAGSVTSIAMDNRFENLSRFASQYARLFGERPSETLRLARNSSRRA